MSNDKPLILDIKPVTKFEGEKEGQMRRDIGTAVVE